MYALYVYVLIVGHKLNKTHGHKTSKSIEIYADQLTTFGFGSVRFVISAVLSTLMEAKNFRSQKNVIYFLNVINIYIYRCFSYI